MGSGSSSQNFFPKGKCVMHDQQNCFDTNAYNEFIQRQFYVDDTHPNPPLIIFEPSTNPLESHSQNQPNHFEILNDEEGDDKETMDMYETRKKFDLFEVHMKKITKLDETITIVYNYCSNEFK